MGRTKPEVEFSESVREEVALAQAVEEVGARVAPAQRADAPDTETATVVEQILSQLGDITEGAAAAAAPPSPVRLPIVFLDALEVTQEVRTWPTRCR